MGSGGASSSPTVALPVAGRMSQLRVLPGLVLISLFYLWYCPSPGQERGCVAVRPGLGRVGDAHISSLSLCPAVRLQLPDGAERGGAAAAQPHAVPARPAVLRGRRRRSSVCVHTTEQDTARGRPGRVRLLPSPPTLRCTTSSCTHRSTPRTVQPFGSCPPAATDAST